MLNHLLGGGDIRSFIVQLLLTLPVILLALSVHEMSHGYMAYKLGDPTANSLGRLTLNPVKHIDIIGFVCMLFFGFGWAKPVPINTRYFKKPRRDIILTSLAGPVSNIFLAAIFALLMKLFYFLLDFAVIPNETVWYMAALFNNFLYYGILLNLSLAIFNLLPIPPLDGSRLVTTLLPYNVSVRIMRYEQIIQIVLMLALFVGILDPVLDFLIGGLMKLFGFVFGLPLY